MRRGLYERQRPQVSACYKSSNIVLKAKTSNIIRKITTSGLARLTINIRGDFPSTSQLRILQYYNDDRKH